MFNIWYTFSKKFMLPPKENLKLRFHLLPIHFMAFQLKCALCQMAFDFSLPLLLWRMFNKDVILWVDRQIDEWWTWAMRRVLWTWNIILIKFYPHHRKFSLTYSSDVDEYSLTQSNTLPSHQCIQGENTLRWNIF
jgi:hypothetical protein